MASQIKNILQVFASPHWGGGGIYVLDLSKNLLEKGYNIVFTSRRDCDSIKHIEPLKRPSYRLRLNGLLDIKSVFKLKKIIQKHDIDLVHTHHFKDTFTALFARVLSKKKFKVIVSRHLVKKANTNFAYSWLYKKVDKIIFVSALAKNEFLSSNPQIDGRKMTVIYNSISPSTDELDIDLRQKYNISPNTILLAFTGRLSWEKGIEVLIASLESLKDLDLTLFIVGKGSADYEHALKQQVQDLDLGNKIIFSGFTDSVQAFIRQTDIGVAPSIWREPFGLSIIEFMKEGKPIITTDNGAQPEYIENNVDGVLVPPSDINALTNAIRDLINNKEKRLQIGSNAKMTFDKQFQYSTFVDKIIDIYNEN